LIVTLLRQRRKADPSVAPPRAGLTNRGGGWPLLFFSFFFFFFFFVIVSSASVLPLVSPVFLFPFSSLRLRPCF
jgi:hypothetical protein